MERQSVHVEKYALHARKLESPCSLEGITHTHKRYKMTTGKRSIDPTEHYTQHSRSQKPRMSACSPNCHAWVKNGLFFDTLG